MKTRKESSIRFMVAIYTANDIDGLLDKLITQLPAISSATLSPVSLVLMDNDANLPNVDKESIISTYKAPVATTDFASGAAEGVINEWVSQYTDGNVKSLVSSVLPAPSKQCITAHTAHLSAYLGHGSYYLEQTFTSPDGKSELKKMVAIYSNTSWLEDEGKLIVPITVSGSIKLVLIMPKGDIATGKTGSGAYGKKPSHCLTAKIPIGQKLSSPHSQPKLILS